MFQELTPPVDGAHGWFIVAKDTKGWLTVNGIIETSTVPIEDYYFPSKLDAHNASLNYYYKHNKSYPWFNELYDMRRALKTTVDTKDISESQVMEFI